ncbi:MCP methyltransferase, CheR-type [Arcobacter nitrofigilis DSM 7299]|uniref:protein-glutamate O-methyltransferase n=1 Tax=Arcobacter nitrofigilis (strain ATCC 33309 / DSM 7299 / CCUG 15893 / LMG 7604 / NCTC 12251 / CI) TaxID=572480 RepID=D5V1I9_ARCNC|nr:protein-glutamate O-methyltransferase CheR [Arcobacter nitrofigilis]ADG93423.1 MCP methyltransferase, CheR-type [Arcobacter nitrofigilis DSM 7299]
MDDTLHLHEKVKELLYSFTGITLTENKDIMISNRLHKLKRNASFHGSLDDLLEAIKEGNYKTEFINAFTTNKTHFFREEFHFADLKNRVLPELLKHNQDVKLYCSASSTGEEPYSMAMTILETQEELGKKINATIIATDIDTNVLQYAANGIYRFSKSSKEFPSWLKPQKYFKKRVEKNLASEEILIKVKPELQKMVTFQVMNLNDANYPFAKNQFDVVFCRNVLIYFSAIDQEKILFRLFRHLKIGGTLYIGHSESPGKLEAYVRRIGQNIFIKEKEVS